MTASVSLKAQTGTLHLGDDLVIRGSIPTDVTDEVAEYLQVAYPDAVNVRYQKPERSVERGPGRPKTE